MLLLLEYILYVYEKILRLLYWCHLPMYYDSLLLVFLIDTIISGELFAFGCCCLLPGEFVFIYYYITVHTVNRSHKP